MLRAWVRFGSSLGMLGAILGFGSLVAAAEPTPAQAPAPAVPPPPPGPAVPPPAPAPPAPVAPPPVVAPSPVAPPPVAPAPVAPPPAAVPASPAPAPATEVSAFAAPPAPVEPAPAVDAPWVPPPPPTVPESASWYESISVGAFADAYYSLDFNFPKAPNQARSNPIRAYDNRSGFGLSWAGIDIQKEVDPVGGTISLRFGPTAERLAATCVDGTSCDNTIGLSLVKQAFASFRPGGSDGLFSLDFGKFDTPYGAEVAEAQYNLNYTRGALYWLGQPAFHTGLRVGLDPSRNVNLKLLAVNGWNRTLDNNTGKTFGLQGTYRLPKEDNPDEDAVTIAAGYLFGPEHADSAVIDCPPGQVFNEEASSGCSPAPNSPGESGVVDRGGSNTKGLRHFIDLTVVAAPVTPLKLLFNASLGIDRDRDRENLDVFATTSWFGVMAAARYAVAEQVGLAGRFEYYSDPDGYTSGFRYNDVKLVTATVTADYSPGEHVVFFLDGRLDWSGVEIFPKGVRDPNAGTAVSATLGAVISTN